MIFAPEKLVTHSPGLFKSPSGLRTAAANTAQHFSLKLICFLSPLDSWINTLSLPFEKGSCSEVCFFFFFVHCSYKRQPSFQIRPEQPAWGKHIYSTNLTPFCSQSTMSSLQLFLIYLLFSIIQVILAADCFLDLPAISLNGVSNFYFVGTSTSLL